MIGKGVGKRILAFALGIMLAVPAVPAFVPKRIAANIQITMTGIHNDFTFMPCLPSSHQNGEVLYVHQ